MEDDAFEVEDASPDQIKIRYRPDGHRWTFTIRHDPVKGRRIIASGRSGPSPQLEDAPARVVTDALRFARAQARQRGLVD